VLSTQTSLIDAAIVPAEDKRVKVLLNGHVFCLGNPSRGLLSNILQALNIKCVRKVEKSHPERCYYAEPLFEDAESRESLMYEVATYFQFAIYS